MAKKLISDIERFLKHVSIDTRSGCWLWLAHVAHNGYGKFYVGSRTDNSRKTIPAHRFSYEHFKVKVPHGFQIDHLCRVRNCVNPNHLEHVTPRENILRSTSFIAVNAKKTHCKRGHAFTSDTTWNYKGRRICKVCRFDTQHQKWIEFKSNRLIQPKIGREKQPTCNKGHVWTPGNIFLAGTKKVRTCRICKRLRDKKQYYKERGVTL